MFESENIEFKLLFTDKIYKEVVAFINTDGGKIYVGIDDNGNHIGIENVDDTYTKITNGIRDNILPDPTMFIKYRLHEDNVIEIDISEGSNKPYYLKNKGLKPTGVFVRQGASKAEASQDQIRQMIKITDGDHYEDERSLNQNLTFFAMQDAFGKYKVEYNNLTNVNLGLVDKKSSMYTNLGLLLSDQCLHTLKIAVFEDEENTVFHSQKEFSGSLFKQLDQAFEFIMLINNNNAVIKGLERIESYDYPEEAIREALLNALVHRDYSYSGSIIININMKEIEVISIGGLLPGVFEDDIKNGVSQPRNKKLADIFHRLRLIEAYGTGIRRIYKLYSNCINQPNLSITTNSFKIILPNMNVGNHDQIVEHKLSNQEKAVIEILRKTSVLYDKDLQKLLNIKQSRSYGLTKKLFDQGLIEIVGRGEERAYKLKNFEDEE